jgi:hypothetical protein
MYLLIMKVIFKGTVVWRRKKYVCTENRVVTLNVFFYLKKKNTLNDFFYE